MSDQDVSVASVTVGDVLGAMAGQGARKGLRYATDGATVLRWAVEQGSVLASTIKPKALDRIDELATAEPEKERRRPVDVANAIVATVRLSAPIVPVGILGRQFDGCRVLAAARWTGPASVAVVSLAGWKHLLRLHAQRADGDRLALVMGLADVERPGPAVAI